MCIRDSAGTSELDPRERKHAFLFWIPTRARTRHRTPSGRACLLYTSDAADERSSVDLGGRRIIKKQKKQKNKKQQHCTHLKVHTIEVV